MYVFTGLALFLGAISGVSSSEAVVRAAAGFGGLAFLIVLFGVMFSYHFRHCWRVQVCGVVGLVVRILVSVT
ncbi:MAG: hypothetical protein GY716_09105 [bacterium]|nr:hypothetical protein [bacterium]